MKEVNRRNGTYHFWYMRLKKAKNQFCTFFKFAFFKNSSKTSFVSFNNLFKYSIKQADLIQNITIWEVGMVVFRVFPFSNYI